MNKNQIFTGTCTDYTYNGLGVVKYGTFCVFVKDMIIGETGEIVITAVKKDYGYGRLLKLEKAIEYRQEATCPISRQCGGCQLQHMTYEHQCFFKQNHVADTLKNIGKVFLPVEKIIPLKDPYAYRNKVILPVGEKNGRTVTGFYRYNSHDIIPMESCCLQTEYSNHLTAVIRELIDKYDLNAQIRNIMIRDFSSTEEAMAVLVTRSRKVRNIEKLAEELAAREPKIKSIIQNINDKETNVVLGQEEIVLYGQPFIRDEMDGLVFEVSSHSFYQVNSRQTAVLYGEAIKLADLKSQETAIDLYCGVGTIGMLASRKAGKVTGVEIVPEAIDNAKRNAEINGITNMEFICGDALTAVEHFRQMGMTPDVVFVDPPRKGCSQGVLENMIALNADRIVYVSCNPSTLARDLNYLQNNGYTVKKIQPVDMFSQTFHVETVCCLYHQKKDFISVPYEPKNV